MEKKPRGIYFPAGIAFALVVLGVGCFAPAAEFSAEMTQKSSGQTMTGNIFIKEKKMRMEMNSPGGRMVHIFLPEGNRTVMLYPDQKMYMEMTVKDPGRRPSMADDKLEEKATKKYLGTETVNGYACEKYELIFHDPSMGKSTQWFSKKLAYPVKMVHQGEQGETVTEYKNIREGGVSDSLFQIPSGYKKMEMPGMGSGMGHGMKRGVTMPPSDGEK
jgi:outer membrane lipoprotein-sorting protein